MAAAAAMAAAASNAGSKSPGQLRRTSTAGSSSSTSSTSSLSGASKDPQTNIGSQGSRTSSGSWHGKCPHCQDEYENISSLKYHVRLIHSDAKNTICCYLCSGRFYSKVSLREHLFQEHQVKYQ
eukprot:maker-scaffold202_size261857-snap-gene-1.22 protein:Tk10172 transcript:maker-scaffold202_size261857-snap-gene-1.22-mRNA-1 annotation:"PREDICTED: uncharacterized protein LOC103505047"